MMHFGRDIDFDIFAVLSANNADDAELVLGL